MAQNDLSCVASYLRDAVNLVEPKIRKQAPYIQRRTTLILAVLSDVVASRKLMIRQGTAGLNPIHVL